VRRHEVLRTTFKTVAGQPVQVIAPHLRIYLPKIDLRQLPVSERGSAAQQLLLQETQQPFNLEQGPLLRVTLLQLSESDYVLAIALHHIVLMNGQARY
jgi:hypothetical protein